MITIEKLEKYRKIAKRFEEQAEADAQAFFEMVRLREELGNNELKARIESGLIDPEKMEKYYDWKRNHKIEIPKRPIDPENLKKAYDGHLAKIINDRSICSLGAGGQPPIVNPSYSSSNSSTECDPENDISHAEAKASDETIGNVARLYAKAWASGEYDANTKTTKTGAAKAFAEAMFFYEIPTNYLPEYGGTIKVTSKLSIFGWYVADTFYHSVSDYSLGLDLLSEDLDVSLIILPGGNYSGKGTPLEPIKPEFPIDSKPPQYASDYFFESNSIAKQSISGPAVELDVVGKGNYTVCVRITLRCKVSTTQDWVPAEATCDFSTSNSLWKRYIQVEGVEVKIVKANPPPPPPSIYYYEPSPGEKFGTAKKPPINPGPYETANP